MKEAFYCHCGLVPLYACLCVCVGESVNAQVILLLMQNWFLVYAQLDVQTICFS